ncbi:hypothetical protein TGAM01_v201556, partial [Trichoderma gamsii]
RRKNLQQWKAKYVKVCGRRKSVLIPWPSLCASLHTGCTIPVSVSTSFCSHVIHALRLCAATPRRQTANQWGRQLQTKRQGKKKGKKLRV